MSTIMESTMKRFLVLAEVEMEDTQYSDLNKKGIEQTDFINSVLADHGRDRGLKSLEKGTRQQ